MHVNDDRTDAAVARVHARVEHARVGLAVPFDLARFEHLDNLAQANLRRGARERVAALRAAGRGDQSGLVQKPEHLARVGLRDALTLGNLPERQRLALAQTRELQEAAQTVLFLCRDLHKTLEKRPPKS